MIDLHTHTLFSDGVLLPSELASRARAAGYTTIAITDHVDASNIDHVVPRIVKVAAEVNAAQDAIRIIPGVEITHVPPSTIGGLVKEARALGALVVVVHGETITEPVPEGTNRAAIEAGADILAHPGLISPQDVELAAKNGVALEITTRPGHSLTNGHVAKLALLAGARMVVNNDAHAPGDLVGRERAMKVALGAGLSHEQAEEAFENSEKIVSGLSGKTA